MRLQVLFQDSSASIIPDNSKILEEMQAFQVFFFLPNLLFSGGISGTKEEFSVLIKKAFQTWLNWKAEGGEIGLSDNSQTWQGFRSRID